MVLLAAIRWRSGARAAQKSAAATPESSLPSVTIFKPVHGMEAELEKNLESFFQQDYPSFEVVLGAREADDAGKPLGLAGIMGGEHSGINESTTTVFLEGAFWSPATTRSPA